MKYLLIEQRSLKGHSYDYEAVTDAGFRSLKERYKDTDTTITVYTKPGWYAVQYDDWDPDMCVCCGPWACDDAECEVLERIHFKKELPRKCKVCDRRHIQKDDEPMCCTL